MPLSFDTTDILKSLCCLRKRQMFCFSPRKRANQASARVPTRHAGVRATMDSILCLDATET